MRPVHPTYCYSRDPQSITAAIDLNIIQQAFTSKTNPSRQIQVENTNSMIINILWQVQVTYVNYVIINK